MALWLETLYDIVFMLFPRLSAVAELGWSPKLRTSWPDFKRRLAAKGHHWDVINISYYQSLRVPWSN